jgi:hypothetical protein
MRSKLKLDLEHLTVDSFDTSVSEKPKGTVFGEQCTCYTQCTCPGCPTCDATCPATCVNTCDDVSCNGTCGATCNTCNFSCYETECGRLCGSIYQSACNGMHCP